MGGFVVGVTEVWTVRHTAVDLPRGVCYGRTDVPLAASFPDEAAAVRRALAGVRFDSVWSSPAGRCVALAEACGFNGAALGGQLNLDERLRELDFGEWEMRRFDEIDDPRLALWYADWLHTRPTGGESFAEQCARVAEFLEELRLSSFRRVLVFTHSGVVAAARIHTGLVALTEAFSAVTPYGSVTKIELSAR
jgi:alpha-ribazole phosphatase